MDNIEHVNAGEKETKEGSKENFIFCPFPHGLGKESATRKKREKSSATTYHEGSTFRLVLGYSCQKDNERNGKSHKEGMIWQRRDLFSSACTPEGDG
jgi:hypothetical protein